MPTFKIPVTWEMSGEYEIEADTVELAQQQAQNLPLPDGSYVEDSFEIVEDEIEKLPESNSPTLIELQIAAKEFKEHLASLSIDSSTLTYEQLVCIGALINGDWDNPELVKYGPLSVDKDEDIKRMAEGLFGVD